jgi:hypothetical protein
MESGQAAQACSRLDRPVGTDVVKGFGVQGG